MNSDVCIQKFIADFSFRLTGGTLRVYQIAVEQMLAFCGKPFDAITKKDIRSWLNSLDKSGYKSSTLRNKLFGLNLFYKYCLEEEIMTYNPVASITFPELEEGIPHYLELSQLTELRELVKGSLQERAIIETLYATGVRIQELVDIKMEDIDWSERIIHIPNGKRKKGRIVGFTRPCKEHMKAYLPERNEELPFLFQNYYKTDKASKRTINMRFEHYAKHFKFRITPHTLRHTFAAHLAMRGMPLEGIQGLLGHDDPNQTELYARLYSHARKHMYDEWS